MRERPKSEEAQSRCDQKDDQLCKRSGSEEARDGRYERSDSEGQQNEPRNNQFQSAENHASDYEYCSKCLRLHGQQATD